MGPAQQDWQPLEDYPDEGEAQIAQTTIGRDVRTRSEAVLDQVEILMRYAGIDEKTRERTLHGIEQQWFLAIAAYLVRDGKRILEAEIAIDWTLHRQLKKLSPTIRTDLPEWESGGTPEVVTIGRRFGGRAQQLGLRPQQWVLFTPAIRNDPAAYKAAAEKVGVVMNGKVPDWAGDVDERGFTPPDLHEARAGLRESK